MMAALKRSNRSPSEVLLIEGYASLFDVQDRGGDRVRAGAFAASLRDRPIPMLLQHKTGAIAGRWLRLIEDGRGLFARGAVSGTAAKSLAQAGLNGLSIGFRPLVWTMDPGGGRKLVKVDLVEVSLVADPMLDGARFKVIAG